MEQAAPVTRITAGSGHFAAADRLGNCTTTVDRGNFVAARRFDGTTTVVVLVVVEQSVQEPGAARSRLAAGIHRFAAANGFDGANAVAAVVAAVVEQAETGVSRVAGEQEQSQKGGGDHTTHR